MRGIFLCKSTNGRSVLANDIHIVGTGTDLSGTYKRFLGHRHSIRSLNATLHFDAKFNLFRVILLY